MSHSKMEHLCTECFENFNSSELLRKHLFSTHECTMKFECPACLLRLNRLENYNRHYRTMHPFNLVKQEPPPAITITERFDPKEAYVPVGKKTSTPRKTTPKKIPTATCTAPDPRLDPTIKRKFNKRTPISAPKKVKFGFTPEIFTPRTTDSIAQFSPAKPKANQPEKFPLPKPEELKSHEALTKLTPGQCAALSRISKIIHDVDENHTLFQTEMELPIKTNEELPKRTLSEEIFGHLSPDLSETSNTSTPCQDEPILKTATYQH